MKSSNYPLHENHSLYHIFGMDTSIKQNIVPLRGNTNNDDENISSKEILYLAGKYIVKYDIESKKRIYAFNSNCECFGCMTVRGDFIYFGEVGIDSSILICSLSELQVLGVLRGGSNVGYTCLDVSHDGTKLCSIGRKPDNLLIVWDLEKMTILMKAKACGQDVFHVSFSPFESNVITTSGKGHIKFWKMDETFTGLKLKGKFGKFGKVEVCNIESFLHLRHDRILSGSDSGYLFLWKDAFLKCLFTLGNDEIKNFKTKIIENLHEKSVDYRPIHRGGVNYLFDDKPHKMIITAGGDGCLKWWEYSYFTSAQLSDEYELSYNTLHPVRTLVLGNSGVSINSNIKFIVPLGLDNFITHDLNGQVFNVDLEKDENCLLWDFHGGKISCVAKSPNETLCVTCGDDGSIYCCNYHLKKTIASKHFPLQCLKVSWCPKEIDNSERSFVVGFSSGTIKFMYISEDRINIIQSIRPHKTNITMLNFKSCGSLFATGDDTGIVFLFKCHNIQSHTKIAVPIGYVECNFAVWSSINWQEGKDALEYIHKDGTQMEIVLSETLVSCKNKTGEEDSMTYRLQIPHSVIPNTTNPKLSTDKVTLKHRQCLNEEKNFDEKFSIVAGSNGNLSILHSEANTSCKILSHTFSSSFLPQFLFSSESVEDSDFILNNSYNNMKNLHIFNEDKSLDGQLENYTLEELLKKKYAEAAQVNATKKKNCVRRIINDMRTEFINIHQLNMSLPRSARLPPCELILNSFFQLMCSNMLQKEISKVDAEHHKESERIFSHCQKLEEIFVDNLEDDHVIISALKSGQKVQSFRMLKLDKNFIQLKNFQSEDPNVTRTEHDKSIAKNSCLIPVQSNKTSDESNINESNSQSKGRNRKTMRMRRKIEIEKKMNDCPTNDNDSDFSSTREDIEEELGDWKLKSSNSYKVPLSKQINLKSKLREMICCEEHIFSVRKSFNSKLHSLCEEKNQLQQTLKTKGDRVKEIECLLDSKDSNDLVALFCEPQLIIQFPDEGRSCGTMDTYKLQSLLPQIKEFPCLSTISSRDLSRMEEDEILERKILMQFESKKLSKEINDSITKFDESLYKLKRERFNILLDTKICEMNLITMFRELELLQQFEEKDKVLRKKLSECISEKIEITKSIDKYKGHLEEKKLQLESMFDNEKMLLNQFDDMVPINDSNRDNLKKIYMKKIKLYDDGDYISDEEEDDSDESVYESDDEIDACPENCPISTYNEVLELRKKRIQKENERKLFQRQVDNTERSHDQFCSKLRLAEKSLEGLRLQIQTFEDKKLKALNEINVSIPLKTNQIYVWEDDNHEIPGIDAPFGEYVVFTHENLLKLVQRSRDLAQEIDKEEDVLKNLKIDLKHRTKDNKHLEESILHQQKRREELQILKFGQKIDMDHLDKLSDKSSVTLNHSSHLQIQKEAKDFEKEMDDMVTKNQEVKKELKKITEESTCILNEIAELSKRQMVLEKDLQRNSGKEKETEDKEKTLDLEILNLKKMKNNQMIEMEKLQQDINKLRRKDGYIYGQLNH